MTRNLTPERISLLTTLLLSAVFSGFLLYFRISILPFLISVFTFGSLTFIIILYGLEVFIYRKIKVIYKTIHHFKTKRVDTTPYIENYNQDPIKRVNEEVIEWARDQKQEISELRASEQFRKEFLGSVSHELKTPIFNIQGYLETLLDGAMDDEEVRILFLKKAAASTERLNNLVNDLLDISKLESGGMHLQLKVFDVNHLVAEVFDSHEKQAASRSITLRFKEGSDEDMKALADQDRIRQVLNNLISNAITYGREKGLCSVGIYDLDRHILVEVSDDGEGIEAEHLPRLFERFYRTDKSRSRNSGGSGLGLSIAKHIMEAHGESIQVKSEPGHGTTFSFTLKKAGLRTGLQGVKQGNQPDKI